MNSIKTNGRNAFLKAVAIYKNRKRMQKTEIINYYCNKNLNINDMEKLWTYYEPVAKNSLFVKILTLRMKCNGNKECDKIVKYLTKLDKFLIPYTHEYSNGAFMNGFLILLCR